MYIEGIVSLKEFSETGTRVKPY